MTSITERNRATITAIFEAMSRGETRPFGEAMAEDFTWRMTGTTAWSGTYAGKVDVQQRMLKSLREQYIALSKEVEDVMGRLVARKQMPHRKPV